MVWVFLSHWLQIGLWRLFAALRTSRSKPCGRSRKAPLSAIYRNQRKPDKVVAEIIRLKAFMPDAGCRRIAHLFNRIFATKWRITVSKSYVAYILRRERYAIAEARKQIRQKKPYNTAQNQIWAIDLTGKQDSARQTHSILGIIDHGTRRLLTLNTPANKRAWTLLGHLFLAIGQYGKPKILRSDNERIFTGSVFRLGLRLAGIRHQRTELGCPWQNGRIERVFGTLKEKLDQWEIANAIELGNALNGNAPLFNASQK